MKYKFIYHEIKIVKIFLCFPPFLIRPYVIPRILYTVGSLSESILQNWYDILRLAQIRYQLWVTTIILDTPRTMISVNVIEY